MDLKNQIELELYFAEYFETILFPVLADLYYQQGDYKRSRKVCIIGLGYHENDSSGRFVLALVEKAEGNLKESEKQLKTVLQYSPDHITAAVMLCEIQTVLGRSPSRLVTAWKRVNTLDPENQTAVEFLARIETSKLKVITDKKPRKKNIIANNKKPNAKEDIAPLNVSVRLATFTLVNVLKNQGLFYQALEVLDLLEEKGEDPDMIRLEREAVKTLLKSSEIK
mgnify:CR=1 FL=1